MWVCYVCVWVPVSVENIFLSLRTWNGFNPASTSVAVLYGPCEWGNGSWSAPPSYHIRHLERYGEYIHIIYVDYFGRSVSMESSASNGTIFTVKAPMHFTLLPVDVSTAVKKKR